jgi:predicted type IV restriction endonuclease
MNGVADIVVITEGGYAVFLEVKATRGVQSADQKEFQKRCEEKGCEYYVVRRLEDIINIGL